MKTRPRKSSITLTGTRIYIRDRKYKYFPPEPVLDPKTGRMVTLITLCPVSDGEERARELKRILVGSTNKPAGSGDFSAWLDKWRTLLLKKQSSKAPKDPARLPLHQKNISNLKSILNVIEKGFSSFDVAQVKGTDVAEYLDFWEGKRVAQVYKSYLSKFFAWCISRKGLIEINPVDQIELEAVPDRDVYITNEQYYAIYDKLLIGFDDKPTRTGEMVQCYMDLCYLLYQRTTEIRLLRWDKVKPEGIAFKPTKTEKSSGGDVIVPVGDDVRKVLARIKSISKGRSTFVIHTEQGTPYTASGIRSLFSRAAERAGVAGLTLKDIRSKAASDAKKAGYTVEEIQVGLVHSEIGSTKGYIKNQAAPVSTVIMKFPSRKKEEN